MQAASANALNWLVWSKTKDGDKNRNRPKPIEAPRIKEKDKSINGSMVLPIDKYLEILSRPRKEA